jgi:glycosyltransferase involved in cell wall biosynthesis
MNLALDMTLTAINRTAAFHIAIDTAKAWTGRISRYRYGSEYQQQLVSDLKALDQLRPSVLGEILGGGLLKRALSSGSSKEAVHRSAGTERLLVLDPLYVLYEELRAVDVVLVHDLTPVTNPEWHNPTVCELYRMAFQRIASSGAKILSVSSHTAVGLWANYGIPFSDIIVIPLYLRQDFPPGFTDALVGFRERAFLFVGSLEVRKNLLGLISAFEASGLASDGFRLRIAGGRGSGHEEISALAKGVAGVELLGFVSDSQLQELYQTCWGFAYPSYLEGFGVPVIEACSWGLPILTSRTGATAEMAPEGALMVDPYETNEIAAGLQAMAALSETARRDIAHANRSHASRFTFERYLAAMEDAVRPPIARAD